mmetsp:Transcript_1017/g.2597  ORF Transcript_1017/g.2597 Transcript_1017/m.2597 type:complete len:273 (+) Transcript_1017:46-864(+)
MKIYVQFHEGDDVEAHWRQQVTLPKKWLSSPCARLKTYLAENYNKARPDSPQLDADDMHLSNEAKGENPKRCEALGDENIISDVVGAYDEIFLRPGARKDCTAWRRSDVKPAEAAVMPLLVPIEYEALQALRSAVEEDDTEKLQAAVEEANLTSPHELLMAETDVRDPDDPKRVVGSEWHGLGGRFAWDSELEGRGEDPGAKVTLTEYARRRGAARVLKLIEVADHCGAPILSGGRTRKTDDIEASANTVADKMGEMHTQLKASLDQRGLGS